MLMVVLGAGASYDSAVEVAEPVAADQYRPPLANQLFENREVFLPIRRNFPEIDPIISYLPSSGAGRPVEQVLQQLQSEAARYPERFKQLAAVRFYLQFLITQIVEAWYNPVGRANLGRTGSCHGATNHLALIDRLRLAALPEPVCLVTFNYDTLIEKALNHFGHATRELADYIASDKFKLFKLHGSVNWARTIIDPPTVTNPWDSVRKLIEHAATLHVSDRFIQVAELLPLSLLDGMAVLPAIAIPVQTKIDFECPAEHITMLRELLPKTTAVLTIGWRGTEQSFLDLLHEYVSAPVHLAACAESEPAASATLEKLTAQLKTATTQIFQHGFRRMIAEGGELAAFLERIQTAHDG